MFRHLRIAGNLSPTPEKFNHVFPSFIDGLLGNTSLPNHLYFSCLHFSCLPLVASSAFDLSKLHINTALKETPSRLLYYTSLLIKSCLYYDKKNNKKRYIITNYIITKRGRTSLTLCIQCKGRKFCARPTCSVFKRFEAHNEKKMEKSSCSPNSLRNLFRTLESLILP